MKYWKTYLGLAFLAALIYFMVFHWSRFLSDFWPIDKSTVGPNLFASLIQYALILITIALLYPPLRKAAERWAERHVQSIKDHVSDENKKIHVRLDKHEDMVQAIHDHFGIKIDG